MCFDKKFTVIRVLNVIMKHFFETKLPKDIILPKNKWIPITYFLLENEPIRTDVWKIFFSSSVFSTDTQI